jgi:tryptophanyl-tRNA synthetase
MKIPTDSASIDDPKDINGTLFAIHTLFITPEEKAELAEKYQYGKIGYKEAKEACIESIERYIKPLRDKYNNITDEEVIKVLDAGKEKISKRIELQMEEVRRAVGLTV